MKILIIDERTDLRFLIKEFLTEEGHNVTTISQNEYFLEISNKKQDFDFIIKNLDEFITDNVESFYDISENIMKLVIRLIGKFLRNIRTRKFLSHSQIKDRLVNLKKLGLVQYAFPKGRNSLKLIKIFESGVFCPPYDYLEAFSIVCEEEKGLENFISTLGKRFRDYNNETDRHLFASLLNIHYQRKENEIYCFMDSISRKDNFQLPFTILSSKIKSSKAKN